MLTPEDASDPRNKLVCVKRLPRSVALPSALAPLLLCLAVVVMVTSPVAANYPTSFVKQVQGYPNIVNERDRCLPEKGTYKYSQTHVCDPTRLLKVDDINRLNEIIINIKTSINSGQSMCQSSSPRPVIAVALLNKMNVGNSPPDRILSYASIFAYYLYDTWGLPSNCHTESDKLIIFYSKADGALYTFAGDLLKERLPSKLIISTAVESRLSFANGIYEGIRFLLEKYRDAMTSTPRLMFTNQ